MPSTGLLMHLRGKIGLSPLLGFCKVVIYGKGFHCMNVRNYASIYVTKYEYNGIVSDHEPYQGEEKAARARQRLQRKVSQFTDDTSTKLFDRFGY